MLCSAAVNAFTKGPLFPMEHDSSGPPPTVPPRRPPVFGRRSADPHPYDPVLDECATCGEPLHAAMAQNIRYDHRVSEEREKWFDDFCGHPRSLRDLWRGVTDYFKEAIQASQDPDYIHEIRNGQNILVGGINNKRGVKGKVKLGRVLDLNGLLQPLQLAAGATEDELQDPRWGRLAVFRRQVNAFNSAEKLGEFLDGQLGDHRSAEEKEQFVENVLLALNFAATKRPFQPSWVTFWADLKPVLKDEEPERWAETLGRKLAADGRWLIALQYTIEEAAMLVRPTQLDADWRGEHFPSPQHLKPKHGGHSMDLGTPNPLAALPREFLHSQLNYALRQWISAGRKLRRTTKATVYDLMERRRQHYRRLAAVYDNVVDWMPEP
jgi:hypothetical protein